MGGLRPNPATHPNLYFWYSMVSKFNPAVSGKWAAGDLPMPAAAASKAPAKAAAKGKPAAAEEDIDEDDLFGDGGEDNSDALAKIKEKQAANQKKKKAPPVAKSIVLIEVKPMSDETDLDALAAKILAIEKDGLFWKTEYRKEPVAFGIFKLIIGFVIEDDKVSVDNDIIPMLEEWEDEVQSVDIQSFNKL